MRDALDRRFVAEAATEAGRAVLTAAFKAFDVASTRARCSLDNSKSAAVLLRCGMTELEATDTHRRFEIARPRSR